MQPVAKVGTICGWYVGDKAYAWLPHRSLDGIPSEFGSWEEGEITTLWSDGSAELKTGSGLLHTSCLSLAKKAEMRDTRKTVFPVGSRVVLLTATPKAGLMGTVITLDEARTEGAGPMADDPFVPVMLDNGYAGGWFPETLGLITAKIPPEKIPEPKNNDGRSTCFWCGKPTRKFGLAYTSGDVCTACGR